MLQKNNWTEENSRSSCLIWNMTQQFTAVLFLPSHFLQHFPSIANLASLAIRVHHHTQRAMPLKLCVHLRRGSDQGGVSRTAAVPFRYLCDDMTRLILSILGIEDRDTSTGRCPPIRRWYFLAWFDIPGTGCEFVLVHLIPLSTWI